MFEQIDRSECLQQRPEWAIADHSDRVANLVESCMETLTDTEHTWYVGEINEHDIARLNRSIKRDMGQYDYAEVGRVYVRMIEQKCLEHVQRRLAQGARDDQVFEVFA